MIGVEPRPWTGRYGEGMTVATKRAGELRLDAVTRSRLDLDTGYGSDLAFGRIG